ncbi:hypothetical protein [Saccharopolyspora spinosa]|uniref:hypothetical protein n=1 Tax=Saccharopolyspora spinosa TaxID=60894 RepID=UPI0011D29889|nr:hypothetical protein [Saccharopolyspora spinosa]
MFDQGLRRAWEEERGRVEALWAELTGMVDDEGEPAGEQMGESGVGRAAALVPAEIATLAELAGRMDRHLRAMPPEFNPNRVRENVETAKQWVRQGQWTPAQLRTVESRLGEQVGESGQGRAAGFVPAEIARLAELAGRMERHLRAMPPEFNPNRVRENVETAKQWVQQGQWTPAQLRTVESTEENPLGEFTGKADLGEALMVSRTRRFPDDPAEVYRYWTVRGSGS